MAALIDLKSQKENKLQKVIVPQTLDPWNLTIVSA